MKNKAHLDNLVLFQQIAITTTAIIVIQSRTTATSTARTVTRAVCVVDSEGVAAGVKAKEDICSHYVASCMII